MNIPKQIKVAGHIYKVLYPYAFRETDKLAGQCDNSLKEIRLKDTDPGGNKFNISEIEQTFIHELLHSIDWVYNNNALEEETIARLAEGLYQVSKDNKLFK